MVHAGGQPGARPSLFGQGGQPWLRLRGGDRRRGDARLARRLPAEAAGPHEQREDPRRGVRGGQRLHRQAQPRRREGPVGQLRRQQHRVPRPGDRRRRQPVSDVRVVEGFSRGVAGKLVRQRLLQAAPCRPHAARSRRGPWRDEGIQRRKDGLLGHVHRRHAAATPWRRASASAPTTARSSSPAPHPTTCRRLPACSATSPNPPGWASSPPMDRD